MNNRPHLIPALITALMLMGAFAPLPYWYYQFLRWGVCGVSVFLAISAYRWNKAWATWLFGVVAVLFNPIDPIPLTREIWQPIDLAAALLFGLSILFLSKPREAQLAFGRSLGFGGGFSRIKSISDLERRVDILEDKVGRKFVSDLEHRVAVLENKVGRNFVSDLEHSISELERRVNTLEDKCRTS